MVDKERQESPWETSEEEPDEAAFSAEKEVEEAFESPWVLEQGVIHEETLDEVIKIGYYSKDQVRRTGIKYLPLGLKRALKRTARKKKVSVQTVQMHSSKHGLMIALHNPHILKLLSVYDRKCKEAEAGTGDPQQDKEAMRAVEERETNVDFANSLKFESSVALYDGMVGPLASLSDALGMSNTKVYCFLCVLSVMTLSLGVGTKYLLNEEVRHFWNKVEARLKRLS